MTTITAKIIHDDDPMSPRDWDNLGTMVCWHPNYTLGDEQISRHDAQETYDEILDTDALLLPLFLYEHSGITMNTQGFMSDWDSGQVGFIYVTAEQIRKEYGDDSEKSCALATKVLQSEVKVYDQYIMGDVWGFVIEQEQDDCDCCGCTPEPEHVDSCFGFFGDDLEGMKYHVDEAYHCALEEAWEARW